MTKHFCIQLMKVEMKYKIHDFFFIKISEIEILILEKKIDEKLLDYSFAVSSSNFF